MPADTKAPTPRRIKDCYYWQAPKKFRDAGYKPSNVRLTGRPGDGLDAERMAESERLTREMLDFYEAKQPRAVRTWADLIHRYRTDKASTLWKVKATTRKDYLALTAIWEKALGENPIDFLTFERITDIHNDLLAKGQSARNIHGKITQLRFLTKYGVLIRAPGAKDVQDVLSNMRFSTSAARDYAPDREMVEAVIRHAQACGLRSLALGMRIQWDLGLRLSDIRGIWLPDEGEGGIVRDGKRWGDGLTWDMVSADLMWIKKVPSKTAKRQPKARLYPLEHLPELRAMLDATPMEKRVGPVIVAERTGLPYTSSGWSLAFRRISRDLGLPPEFQMRDIRAGAITEGIEAGADVEEVRDFAGHTQTSTTNLYMRGRERNTAKVVKLRQGVS